MTRYLVSGVSGLLGINLALQWADQHEVIGIYHQHSLQEVPFRTLKADLSQPGEARRIIEQERPEVVINCAALANVDECEKNPRLAQRLNTDLPGELAKVTSEEDILLIHISTDAVFDGKKGNYTETDQPNPINLYARTKLEGEYRIFATNSTALIARVNFYGWSMDGKRSLSEWIFNNLSIGKQINGFTDVIFCPLLVNELVELFMNTIEKKLHGLYHIVSSECLTKYDFACRLARQFGFDENLIIPSSWSTAGLTAVRSPNLLLRTDKLASDLGNPMPEIAGGLKRYHQQYNQNYPQWIQGFAK